MRTSGKTSRVGLILTLIIFLLPVAASSSPWSATLSWEFDREKYYPGEDGWVEAWVENTGSERIQVMWVGIHFDWMEEGAYSFLDLSDESKYADVGEKIRLGEVSFSIPSSVVPKDYSYHLSFEVEYGPPWRRGYNHTAVNYLTVLGPFPNLSISAASLSKSKALQGDRVRASGRVCNEGSGNATDVRVTVTAEGAALAQETYGDLAPTNCSSFTLSFVVPEDLAEGNRTIEVQVTCSEGNASSRNLVLRVLKRAPVINITAVSYPAEVSQGERLAVTASFVNNGTAAATGVVAALDVGEIEVNSKTIGRVEPTGEIATRLEWEVPRDHALGSYTCSVRIISNELSPEIRTFRIRVEVGLKTRVREMFAELESNLSAVEAFINDLSGLGMPVSSDNLAEARLKLESAREEFGMEDYGSAKDLLESALEGCSKAITEVRDKVLEELTTRIEEDRAKTDDPYALLRLEEANRLVDEAKSLSDSDSITGKLRSSLARVEDAEARMQELSRRRVFLLGGAGVILAICAAIVIFVYWRGRRAPRLIREWRRRGFRK